MSSIQALRAALDKIITAFLRLSIESKMLLAYLPLALLIILFSVFTLISLQRLNRINDSILNKNAPLIEVSDKLIDNLVAQELYGRRYVILNTPDMMALFWERSKEFDQLIEKMKSLPNQQEIPSAQLDSLHHEYTDLFIKGINQLRTPSSQAAKKYDAVLKSKEEELIQLIKNLSTSARSEQNNKIHMISSAVKSAFWVIALVCSLGALFGVGAAMFITRNIAGNISRLTQVTREVAEGKFDCAYENIQTHDELGELLNAFCDMTKRLKILEERFLDTDPLTRLPGGIAIENMLKKRLDAALPLAFCLIDMDNFKAYNDRYGYAKGSEIIQATAHIIEKAVSEYGTAEDFVGHIGGDDFVLVTTPERFSNVCDAVIKSFDKAAPDFYEPEDRARGYIVGKTRQGQEINFPIMSVSIAVVTNAYRPLTDPAQVGELAAELKEYAKSLPGSNYVVDKRRGGQKPQGAENKVVMFPKKGASEVL